MKQNWIYPGLLEEIKSIRRHLHAHPELSFEEYETAKYLRTKILECEPDEVIDDLGGTGFAAVFDSRSPGKTLLFRSELDALPIPEKNTFDYRSKTEMVSHKCGHDGHASTLLGLAKVLHRFGLEKGKVILLYQPAEEIGAGAQAVIHSPNFGQIQPDWVFAYHNLPGIPMHTIVVREGVNTSFVKSLIIQIDGKTAHAAEPENGKNPAYLIADLLEKCAEWSNNDITRKDFQIITPVHLNVGQKNYGIAPGAGELHLTIRTWTPEVMQDLENNLLSYIQERAQHHGMQTETEWTHIFYSNKNHPEAVKSIEEVAESLDLAIKNTEHPFKWGEDFGLFTQQFKGGFFGIGAGVQTPALHTTEYDFPDEILATGISMFRNLIEKMNP